MNYEEKTDLELSEMVAADRFSAHEVIEGKVIVGIKRNGGDNVISISGVFSINNPADMWPIIKENRISIYPSEGPDFMPWQAGCKSIIVTGKNPLRAAAIVFLMMKGVKPDERI